MQFSLLDFKINDTCEGSASEDFYFALYKCAHYYYYYYELHPPHLINVATVPCEIRNTKNACEHNFSF